MSSKIVRLPEVKNRTGLSRSTIYLRMSEGRFPKPISLGAHAVGWVESEIEAWLQHQIEESRRNVCGLVPSCADELADIHWQPVKSDCNTNPAWRSPGSFLRTKIGNMTTTRESELQRVNEKGGKSHRNPGDRIQ
jgi:prophage regulatory protein